MNRTNVRALSKTLARYSDREGSPDWGSLASDLEDLIDGILQNAADDAHDAVVAS